MEENKIYLVINRSGSYDTMNERVIKAFSNKEKANEFKSELGQKNNDKKNKIEMCFRCPMQKIIEEANMAPKVNEVKLNIFRAIDVAKQTCSHFKECKEFGDKEKFNLLSEKAINYFLNHPNGFCVNDITEELICMNYNGDKYYDICDLGEFYVKEVDYIDEK